MKYSLATKCIHHRGGLCYFLISAPNECKMCVNFVSADPEIKRKFGAGDRAVVTFYDIIKKDPRYRAMFPQSGTSVQMSLGLYEPGRDELPEDEEQH